MHYGNILHNSFQKNSILYKEFNNSFFKPQSNLKDKKRFLLKSSNSLIKNHSNQKFNLDNEDQVTVVGAGISGISMALALAKVNTPHNLIYINK